MSDKAWKAAERAAAKLIDGTRHKANSGGRVDVEGPHYIGSVKHVRVLSLAQLEALAVEMDHLGRERGKAGVVLVKRRAGQGTPTPFLVVMTEATWKALQQPSGRAKWGQSGSASPHDDKGE